jgi:hypothetical protein
MPPARGFMSARAQCPAWVTVAACATIEDGIDVAVCAACLAAAVN